MKAASVMFAALLSVGQSGPVTEAGSWPVYLRRAGAIRIGMSLAAVRRALGDPAAFLAGQSINEPAQLDAECAYLSSRSVPKNLVFMFSRGLVIRIDVRGSGIRTASGAEVGDTEDSITRLYPGRITVAPHKYIEGGHYLNYRAVDRVDHEYGMVFETESGRVTRFRTGTLAGVALVEGCG